MITDHLSSINNVDKVNHLSLMNLGFDYRKALPVFLHFLELFTFFLPTFHRAHLLRHLNEET